MGWNPLGVVDALLTDLDRTLLWLFKEPAREREAYGDILQMCSARGVPVALRSAADCDPYDLWADSYRWALANTPPSRAEALNGAIAARLVAHEVSAAAEARLFEGVWDALEQLSAHQIPVAVVSNNAADAVWLALKANQAEGFVACVLGREPSHRLGDLKPSPVLLTQALDEVGCPPERAIFVGDSTTDMRAGRAAGVRSIGLRRHSRTSGSALTAAGAAHVLDDFADLRAFLPG